MEQRVHDSARSPTIARIMLERVEVIVVGETERAGLVCHWMGGPVTKHAFTRPVRWFEQLVHFDKLLARITKLLATACRSAELSCALAARHSAASQQW